MDDVEYVRLQRAWCWTDSLVDFRISFLTNRLFPLDCNAPVYSLTSVFYTEFTSAGTDWKVGFEHAAHFSGSIDIFALDFLLIPVVLDHHWSLVVVARPGAARRPATVDNATTTATAPAVVCASTSAPATDTAGTTGATSLNLPVIMHMDPSRGIHCPTELGDTIKR